MHRVESTIADYVQVFVPIRAHRLAMRGRQLGNPAEAGRALHAVVEAENRRATSSSAATRWRLVADARAAFDADTCWWTELRSALNTPAGNRAMAGTFRVFLTLPEGRAIYPALWRW